MRYILIDISSVVISLSLFNVHESFVRLMRSDIRNFFLNCICTRSHPYSRIIARTLTLSAYAYLIYCISEDRLCSLTGTRIDNYYIIYNYIWQRGERYDTYRKKFGVILSFVISISQLILYT